MLSRAKNRLNLLAVGNLWEGQDYNGVDPVYSTSSMSPPVQYTAGVVRDVPNSGFRLFGRIQIVLWTIRPNTITNTHSWMTQNIVILLILIILWIIYQQNNVKNQNDQIKSLLHAIVTWSRQHWPWGTQVDRCFQHRGKFCCQSTWSPTIHICYDDAIRPNTNRLFGPPTIIRRRSEYESNIRYIPNIYSLCLQFLSH